LRSTCNAKRDVDLAQGAAVDSVWSTRRARRHALVTLDEAADRLSSVGSLERPMLSGTLVRRNSRNTRLAYGYTTFWAMNVSAPEPVIETGLCAYARSGAVGF